MSPIMFAMWRPATTSMVAVALFSGGRRARHGKRLKDVFQLLTMYQLYVPWLECVALR